MKIEVLLHDFCEGCSHFRCKQVDQFKPITLSVSRDVVIEPRELKSTDMTCQNIESCAELSKRLCAELAKRIEGRVVEE